MIKYDLICETCKKVFSSWFASFKEYEKIKKKKIVKLSPLWIISRKQISNGAKS